MSISLPLPDNEIRSSTMYLNALFDVSESIRPRISVIIPTLNEEKNLPYVLPGIPQWVDELVIVDGHSTDDTISVARRLCPDVRIVMQEGRGKGDALRTGFATATGDIIVMLDGDGSTDPAEIPSFVAALLAGSEFAKGSRFLQGAGTADMTALRKFGNAFFVRLVRNLFGGKYTDLCYGYNAFWRHVLPQLDLDADGFEIETLMNVRALQAGLKVVEVPSYEAERIHGDSLLRTFPDGWRVLKTIFREAARRYRRSKPVPARELQPASHTYRANSALQLLVNEGLHLLFFSSDHLNDQARLLSLEAIRDSFRELQQSVVD